MALSSMTGFARADGAHGSYRWTWELKSVNAKGLEVRLRLPPGWDSVEVPVFLVSGGQTVPVLVRRRGADSVELDFAGSMSRVAFDRDGREVCRRGRA